MNRMDRDFRQMDNWMNSFFNEGMRTDIEDKGEHFELTAELPGFDKSEIKMELQNDFLTISATHNEESTKEDKEQHYTTRERNYCNYQRSFNVSGIDSESIKADYKNGVLHVNLPKKDPKQLEGDGAKQIAIE